MESVPRTLFGLIATVEIVGAPHPQPFSVEFNHSTIFSSPPVAVLNLLIICTPSSYHIFPTILALSLPCGNSRPLLTLILLLLHSNLSHNVIGLCARTPLPLTLVCVLLSDCTFPHSCFILRTGRTTLFVLLSNRTLVLFFGLGAKSGFISSFVLLYIHLSLGKFIFCAHF